MLEEAIEDSYERLIFSSVERESRNETETAQRKAMKVFALNLKKFFFSHHGKVENMQRIGPGL